MTLIDGDTFLLNLLLVSGLDDRDDKNDLLTLEAMCSLSNVVAVMNEDEVRPILMNVLLRIRPCFEKVERHTAKFVLQAC
jgi:hypothetical protein